MTDLQASLMVIGGTIVAGVISYNKWQEYKARKNVERVFSFPQDDAPRTSSGSGSSGIYAARQEPTLAPESVNVSTKKNLFEEPDLVSMSAMGGGSVFALPAEKDLPVDELVDCVIPLVIDTLVRGENFLPALQSLRYVGNKPVHFIGRRDDGVWESIAHGGAYIALRAGVQLADRNSALNELEYSELVTRLRQLADGLEVELDVPDMTDVMVKARALHQFATEYDARLGVNIQSNGAPWAINTLLAALERQGFDLRTDGRLVMPDGDGGILFSLSTNVTLAAEITSRLTLLLDVPCVAPLRDGFGAMVACAKALSARLDGTIVDDSNQPLSKAALDEIAEQVNVFYTQMEAANILAGSTRALRLFSHNLFA